MTHPDEELGKVIPLSEAHIAIRRRTIREWIAKILAPPPNLRRNGVWITPHFAIWLTDVDDVERPRRNSGLF